MANDKQQQRGERKLGIETAAAHSVRRIVISSGANPLSLAPGFSRNDVVGAPPSRHLIPFRSRNGTIDWRGSVYLIHQPRVGNPLRQKQVGHGQADRRQAQKFGRVVPIHFEGAVEVTPLVFGLLRAESQPAEV